MGLINIQVLTEDDDRHIRLKQAALEEALIEAHRHGDHPYGLMLRDCPLCQAGKAR